MTEVKTIKCEIHCQNGESIHAAFPAVPGIWEREEIYVEVSENRSYGCRYGQIRLNMRQGALRKEKPIRVSLPTVQSPEKITAMYMLNDWWTRPAFVEGFQEIPARTQVAFLKYPDRFACLVPMVGKTFKTYLEAGTEQEVCLEMLSSLDGQTEVDEPLYVLGEADTLADAVHKVFAWLTKRMGVRTREQRRMPEMFRFLGWCSWDAFYREITEEKVRQKARELVEKKIPVRWMLMDDGWLSTKGELLCDFAPEPAKFPNGFGKMIADIKAESDIRWFGVWHALCGYWQGVAPESKLEGQEHAHLYRTADGKIMPNPLTGEGFYRDWYEKLHADGIDFVKVDGQSSFWSFTENSLTSVPRQRECTKPWKAALLTWMVPSSTVWEWRWRIFCPDRPPQFPETVMTLCPTKKTALWNIYCRMLTIRCIMMSCIIVTGICSGQSMRMPLSTACCGRSAAAPSTSVTKLGTQIRMC